jgi:hypothetical protein
MRTERDAQEARVREQCEGIGEKKKRGTYLLWQW